MIDDADDQRMVEQTIALALSTGVPRAEIEELLAQAAREPDDAFTTPVLCGRLHHAIRVRRLPTAKHVGRFFPDDAA